MQTSHELRQTEQSSQVSARPHTVKCQAGAQLGPEKYRYLSHQSLHKLFTLTECASFSCLLNGKIKTGLFPGNVNTRNFSLSGDILMESSPLSCQIKKFNRDFKIKP